MISRAERFVDKLPLVGKFWVDPFMKDYIRSKPENASKKLVNLGILLGVFTLGHAYQAKLGVEAFTLHLQHIENTGDGADLPFMCIDAVGAMVNTAVSLRQGRLIYETSRIRQRKTKYNRGTSDVPTSEIGSTRKDKGLYGKIEENIGRKPSAFIVSLAVTGIGLGAIITSYNNAQDEHAQEVCVMNADNAIRSGEQKMLFADKPALEAYRQSWIDYCQVDSGQIMPVELPS